MQTKNETVCEHCGRRGGSYATVVTDRQGTEELWCFSCRNRYGRWLVHEDAWVAYPADPEKACHRCGTDDPNLLYADLIHDNGLKERVCEYCEPVLCYEQDRLKEKIKNRDSNLTQEPQKPATRTFKCIKCSKGCLVTANNSAPFVPDFCPYDVFAEPRWEEIEATVTEKPNFLLEMDYEKIVDFFYLQDKEAFLTSYSYVKAEEYDEVVKMLSGKDWLHYFSLIYDLNDENSDLHMDMLRYLTKSNKREEVYEFVKYMIK